MNQKFVPRNKCSDNSPMLKFFLSLLLISLPVFATPDNRLGNLIDTLSQTPASLSGDISIASNVTLGSSRMDMGILHPTASMNWRRNAPIGFRLTENELNLNTDGAFYVQVAGIKFKVKSIRYHRNGRFQVDMDSPILERTMETRLAQAIEQKFKGKMDLAFRELSAVRNQRTGRDVQGVINRVLDIFKDPAGPGIFDNIAMTGEVNLNFDFPAAKTLSVNNDYVAEVTSGDSISAGGRFTRTGNRFNVSEVVFRSYNGVTFRPERGSRLSLNSLRVTQVTISDRGIEPVMVSGAEETITGVRQLIALIAAAEGSATLGAEPGCDPRIQAIQTYLQRELNGQLAPLIRQHRTALIQAGLDPQMLHALEG